MLFVILLMMGLVALIVSAFIKIYDVVEDHQRNQAIERRIERIVDKAFREFD